MTVSQKAALSLLISVFLFAGFAVLAFTGLFDLVEARFYNPSITKSLNREVSLDSETVQEFLAELQSRFAGTMNEAAVRRSVLPNQSAEDIFERTRIYGVLLESLGGLQWVRFVDSGGVRIHFSTAPQDILSQDRLSIAYRNYNDGPGNLPYDQVEVPAGGDVRFTLDGAGDRIILSFPFYDTFEVYRGTALFSVSVRAVAERLVSQGRIKVGDDVAVISSPPGLLSGLPGTARVNILSTVSAIWGDGLLGLTPLDSTASETTLALISSKTGQGIFVGRLVNETLFSFPQSMKVILLVSIFLTIYLAIFLSFNLRQDTMTIIQNRLKGLQISLIEQYYDRKGDVDWTHWTRELEQRREDIRAEVKRGVRAGRGRRSEEDIDSLIDKSWDELLTVIGGRRNAQTGIDEEKLQSILNRILQAAPALTTVSGQLPASAPAAQPPAPEEELEELAEEPEALEEVEEAEELAEEPEALEEVEEAEELAEEPEALEEIGEAEPAGAAEEPEELSELEEVEEGKSAVSVEARKDYSGGLLAAAEKASASAKESNAPLAVGEGDIPYIEESGGMEIVGEDIDSVLSAMSPDDEPAELEELGEAEELEALEETGGAESAGPPTLSEEDIAELASKIEFSPVVHTDVADERDQPLDTDFEIVSPFATMLSNISVLEDGDEDDEEKEPGDDLAAAPEIFADLTEDPDQEKKNSAP